MAADRLLAVGKDTATIFRELGVSEATYHRWRNQFAGLKAENAERLKDLERENATVKRLLADAELEKAGLREIAAGNLSARSAGERLFVTSSGCRGSASASPAAWPGNTAPPNAMNLCQGGQRIRMHRFGSGCAPTPRPILVAGSGPLTMTPVLRVRSSITISSNGFSVWKGCVCRSGGDESATGLRRHHRR